LFAEERNFLLLWVNILKVIVVSFVVYLGDMETDQQLGNLKVFYKKRKRIKDIRKLTKKEEAINKLGLFFIFGKSRSSSKI